MISEETEKPFKRGILLGILIIIGILGYAPYDSYIRPFNNKNALTVLYIVSIVLGIAQIILAYNYGSASRKILLIACFVIEGVYYIFSVILLVSADIFFGIKVFGLTIAIVLICIIISSIKYLVKNISTHKTDNSRIN